MVVNFDPKKIKLVPITQVRPNTWNPKDKDTDEYKKVVESIKIKGLRGAIAVRENDGETPYEIIDGEQRWTAATELGYTELYIYNEGKVTDKEAMELTIWWQQQVPMNETKLGTLILQLNQYPNIELPYSKVELDRYAEMGSFDFGAYNQGKAGEQNQDTYEEGVKTLLIKCSDGQYETIIAAINKVKEQAACPDGRALELVCADYLAGAPLEESDNEEA